MPTLVPTQSAPRPRCGLPRIYSQVGTVPSSNIYTLHVFIVLPILFSFLFSISLPHFCKFYSRIVLLNVRGIAIPKFYVLLPLIASVMLILQDWLQEKVSLWIA